VSAIVVEAATRENAEKRSVRLRLCITGPVYQAAVLIKNTLRQTI
jgi:hypothetical protein